jgi:hypothetical protein
MSTQLCIRRLAGTPAGAAPVAMKRGRHDDRVALARLRVERRWLVRDRDKAGLAPDPAAARSRARSHSRRAEGAA